MRYFFLTEIKKNSCINQEKKREITLASSMFQILLCFDFKKSYLKNFVEVTRSGLAWMLVGLAGHCFSGHSEKEKKRPCIFSTSDLLNK